jgi:ribose transport system permease protein
VNCLASVLVIGSPLQIVGGIILCLVAGAAFGLANGIIVVYGRIQPIIATLATAAIALGIALFLRPKPGGKVDEDLSWGLTNTLGDFADTYGIFDGGKAAWFQPIAWLPIAAILLVVIIAVVWLPLRRTVTGRTIYAIGSAEGAAFMSGLPIVRAKLTAFTLAGLLAGMGGLFLAIETSSGNADLPQAGAYTLNSIAAVVIGGTSLLGGSGSAVGSVMGALVLRVISFNFRVFDVPPLVQPLVEGLVLLAAVSLAALPVLRVKNMLELFR